MPPEPNVQQHLQALINCLADTREDEADCVEFDQEADCLAEWIAAGAPPSVIKPRIEAHLQHSPDCNEEFNALIAVLKAEQQGELD